MESMVKIVSVLTFGLYLVLGSMAIRKPATAGGGCDTSGSKMECWCQLHPSDCPIGVVGHRKHGRVDKKTASKGQDPYCRSFPDDPDCKFEDQIWP